MKSVIIDNRGNIDEKDFDRKDLINKFKIHLRDLRPIFLMKQVSTIIRRGNCLIVNLRSTRLLISQEKVYVFGFSQKINKELINEFVREIKSDENILFELKVLSAGLKFSLANLIARFESIERLSQKILEKLNKSLKDQDFEKLLSIKKQLSHLSNNIKEISEAIEEILEDENIYDLFLQKKPKEIDEAESILEDYLEQIEDVTNRVDELNENIDDTQEILTLKLSNRRNRIIRFDLLVSAITAIFGMLGIIVGLYGVNLTNHLELNPHAFLVLALFIGFLLIFCGGLILIYLKRKDLI